MSAWDVLRRKRKFSNKVKIPKDLHNVNVKKVRPVLPRPVFDDTVFTRPRVAKSRSSGFLSTPRTLIGKNRVRSHPSFEVRNGVEFFRNRRIIGRDVKVNEGIYLGAGAREAIVVDRKYGELNKLFEKAKKRAVVGGKVDEMMVLKSVFEVVDEAMPVKDNDAVERVVRDYGVKQDGKIALDVFLQKGVGVCRHNALAVADLLQRFKEEGVLKGSASVDRNTRRIVESGKSYNAGHAWCRYTNSAGEIFLIDPMHGKIKKLSELELQRDWDYRNRERDF